MPASRALSGLGLLLSTTPAIRQLAVPSEACASCSLRAVITSTRPFDFVCAASSGPQPRQLSLRDNGYACMHSHAGHMHTCTHSDDPACSSRPGANLDCITCPGCPGSSSALQRRLLAPRCTQGSKRFFELPTPFCRHVDALVNSLCDPMPAAWPMNQPGAASGMWVRTYNR